MMEEQALLDKPNVDQDAPTVYQMTDVKIVQMVQQEKNKDNEDLSDSEEDEEGVQERVSVHNSIQLIIDSIEGLKQRCTYFVQEIITVRIGQKCLSILKPKYMRQSKLDKWFNQAKEQCGTYYN
jgi:hypothetical protein